MKKVKRLLRILLGLISIILSITFVVELNKLGVLPSKYFKLLVIGVSLIDLLIILFVTIKYKTLHIIGIIFSLLIGVGSIIGIDVSRNANILIKNAFNKTETEEIEYSLIVLKDSEYKEISELENKIIGYYSIEDEFDKKTINDLKKEINCKEQKYASFNLLKDELYDKKTDAIFINSGTYQTLTETDSDFKEKTRVLDTMMIKFEKLKVDHPKKTDGAINIEISGIDTEGKITTVSRSDVNIIVTVNPKTHQILLTSIPRDTFIQLHGTTGLKDKLSHSGYYGINMTKSTLEDFLNIDIDYYVRVNFDGFVEFIDAIGGVEVDNDEDFNANGYYFPVGRVKLQTGKKALAYARHRKTLKRGDYARGEHQEKVITGVINKVTTDKNILLNYSEIMKSLDGLFQTDMSDELFKNYVKDQIETMPKWTVNSISIKCTGTMSVSYSTPTFVAYAGIPNNDSVNDANKYITGILNGKTYEELKSK